MYWEDGENEQEECDEIEIFMESEEFGLETFGPYLSLEEAYSVMTDLRNKVIALNDGIERVIGFKVNKSKDKEE